MNKQGLKSIWLLIALALLAPASMTLADTGVLNANTASPEELAGLPHLDEVLAEIIVDNRPFVTIGELHDLLGADLDGNQLEVEAAVDHLAGGVAVDDRFRRSDARGGGSGRCRSLFEYRAVPARDRQVRR